MSDIEERVTKLENEAGKYRAEVGEWHLRSEALRLACASPFTSGEEVVRVAGLFEAWLKGGSRHEPHDHADDKPKTTEPKTTEPQEAKPAPAAPQPAAGKTFEDCAKSFQAYVAKGNGKTAGTARAAIIARIPHYTNFRALTPEECALAVEIMDAA